MFLEKRLSSLRFAMLHYHAGVANSGCPLFVSDILRSIEMCRLFPPVQIPQCTFLYKINDGWWLNTIRHLFGGQVVSAFEPFDLIILVFYDIILLLEIWGTYISSCYKTEVIFFMEGFIYYLWSPKVPWGSVLFSKTNARKISDVVIFK